MNQSSVQLGAHEVIVMNEALMTKSANVELLSFLANEVQDPQLQSMLQHQAQTALSHYTQGVRVLQNQSMGTQMQGTVLNPGNTMTAGSMVGAQPKLGLRHPSMPRPDMQAQTLSERTVCTVVLNLHKHGATAWTSFALECTNPQLRTFLMEGAQLCDRAAYETWSYMNQKGYYQVPTLKDQTTNTMIQAFQTPNMVPNVQGMNNFQ